MATIYTRKLKTGTSYTLQWLVNGTRHRKALGMITAKEAKKKLLEHELGIISECTESINVPYFEDYAEEYKNWHVTQYPRSYLRVEGIVDKHLIPYFKGKVLDMITQEDVEAYRLVRAKTHARPGSLNNQTMVKNATINKEVKTLKAMLTRAVNLKIITISSLNMLRKLPEHDSKQVDYFTYEQLDLLYKSPLHGHWWMLLANTGMRLGELRHLKWEHVKESFIHIESTELESTKSGKSRIVNIGDNVRKALLTFWRIESGDTEALNYPQIGGYVFPRYAKNSLSQAARRDVAVAGLKGSAHKLRHTYISLLAMNGTPLAKLQLLAGHSTPMVTMRYMHLSPDYLSDIAQFC